MTNFPVNPLAVWLMPDTDQADALSRLARWANQVQLVSQHAASDLSDLLCLAAKIESAHCSMEDAVAWLQAQAGLTAAPPALLHSALTELLEHLS